MTENPSPPAEPDAAAVAARAKAARRGDRTVFWLGSIGRATLLLYVVSLLVILIALIRADIAAGEFTAGAAMRDLIAAGVWAFLLVVGSCFYSIPLATLVVAAIRGLLRRRHRAPETHRNADAAATTR